MNNSDDNISDMDTDELLSSPIEPPATWTKWTAQDIKEIAKLQNYHMDMIIFISQCRASGPSQNFPPKKIRSEILKRLYIEDTIVRYGYLRLSLTIDIN